MKRLRNKNAQALAELAIFGALLLFCFGILIEYGLLMNYQQNSHMQAFRRALQQAAENMRTSMQAQYVLVEDKPIPNPQEAFGIPERRTVSSSANITWSSGLAAYLPNNDPEDIPKVYYNINDQYARGTQGFTTAGFYNIKRDEQNRYHGDIPWDNLFNGATTDTDDDRRDELIVIVDRNGFGLVTEIKILDYQLGQINPDDENQGLQQDYTRLTTLDNATLQNSESWYKFFNTTNLSGVQDIFNRAITTRYGDRNIVSTLNPPIPSARWETEK